MKFRPFVILFAAALSAPPALLHAEAANPRQTTIGTLLTALKHAPSEAAAAPIEHRLRELWLNAGSPAVTLLMGRGLRELKAGEYAQAIEDFGDAIVLDPKLAEAYHQRAIARYHAGDTAGAIADIGAALQQEPNDFAALETLAEIAEARENWKGAYEAWGKLLQIDPMARGGQDHLKELKRKAFGEET